MKNILQPSEKKEMAPRHQDKPKNNKKPNESGSLQIDGFVKIYDPNTKETYVEKRA